VYVHHKDMEAYACSEGVFGQPPTEKGLHLTTYTQTISVDLRMSTVHMWVSEGMKMLPRTLYAPYSCRCYWQIEKEKSSIDGVFNRVALWL
jgi:hypothetical protein